MGEALLDAWREHPSKELGALLLAEPLPETLADLKRELDEGVTVLRMSPFITVLRRHLDDPRITPLIVKLARGPGLDRAPAFGAELHELWRKNRDPEGADVMGPPGPQYAPLPAEARPLVEALRQPVPLLRELAAVYAEPDSLAHRQVLADKLLERADNWGALIALQLGARPGAEETALRAAALDARLAELLGPGVTVLEVEGGFATHVRVDAGAAGLRATPAWRMVTELKLRFESWKPDPQALISLLHSPELQRLHAIWDLQATLASLDPSRCRIHTFGFNSDVVPQELGQLLGRLPSGRKLIVRDVHFPTVLRLCADRELERYELELRGRTWRLEWKEGKALVHTGDRLAGEWYEIFTAASERAKSCTLHVVAPKKVDRRSIEPMGRHFRSMTIAEP